MDNKGYNLWLDYHQLVKNNKAKAEELFSSVIVPDKDSVFDSIAHEVKKIQKVLETETTLSRSIHSSKAKPATPGCIFALPKHYDSIISSYIPKAKQKTVSDALKNTETGDDGFILIPVLSEKRAIIASHSPRGLLYGCFSLIRWVQTEQYGNSDAIIIEKPSLQYRMLNHWDNLDRSVERGYAGKSLWKWEELPETIDSRYTDYARATASIGLNATVLNNVNDAQHALSSDFLLKVKVLADIFRNYGITVFLSVNFASPIILGQLKTADPLDFAVRQWWKDRVKDVYRLIPDFGGFLVKADSEGQPGPFAYGRSHADGANMLAEALNPYRGVLIWRAFVYGHGEEDRLKTAYTTFMALDGDFKDNTALQVKNGPLDFQPREPVHPLFGGIKKTNLFMEFQITQEYLGQGNHLVFLAPMWQEILSFDTFANGKSSDVASLLKKPVNNSGITGIAGVTNIGDDTNWCGSVFHAANWYAFGRLAWNPELSSESIADEWIRASFGNDKEIVSEISSMLLGSWEACVDYTAPFGLHHIMKEGHHYGPDPGFDSGPRADWRSTYYHKADSEGLGFNRTRNGNSFVDQYYPENAERFNSLEICEEKYLVWFHHVPWTHILSSGKTLAEELPERFAYGVRKVTEMQNRWSRLKGKINQSRYTEIENKLKIQKKDAEEWEQTCVPYFLDFYHRKYKQ